MPKSRKAKAKVKETKAKTEKAKNAKSKSGKATVLLFEIVVSQRKTQSP